ncbi:hypothetical protein Afil01_04350 [Actinorhabdospora filicis]|uniref:DUF4439 domain-containing protein n=1 Tax=Actinorhabdospora filicis TaxID=1785913 RepID=A0A9W6SGL4_9ACTN|nr:ferritin-like domain-containing protein [Actinorhabdospora filicis]GLZ75628.1 hypothetical protein Afil01_04350 [Actinorhabdospora filicis]
MAELTGIAAGLAAEHALIYAYGVAGAQIRDKSARSLAATAEQSHRDLRDALTEHLSAVGVEPPSAEAGYTLPTPVTNEDEATALLAGLETAATTIWRTATGVSGPDDRRRCVAALANAATQAARWRAIRGDKTTAPFPGA